MSILTGALTAISEWFLEKIFAKLSQWIQSKLRTAEIVKEAQSDKEELDEAQTEKENEDAVTDTLHNTFGP